MNRALVLDLVRERGPISRASISRISNLNKSTISSIVDGLMHEDLLTQERVKGSGLGRKPLNLRLKTERHLVGAIAVDADVTRVAIVDIDGTLRHALVVPTGRGHARDFVSTVLSKLESARKQHHFPRLRSIGVTVSGVVDSAQAKVEFAPSLGWKDLELGALVHELCPDVGIVAIENDAKASAVAELWFGRRVLRGEDFVFVSVGPGVGTGVVIDNHLLKGQAHLAGEFGHMTLVQDGEPCVCGSRGCWQAYASERATIARYVRARALTGADAERTRMGSIIHAAFAGEAAAREELLRMGDYLGLGISNIIKAVDPDTIILGGEIIRIWDMIYPAILAGIKRGGFYGKLGHTKIAPTSLGERPSLLGAAAISYREFFAAAMS